MKKIVLLWVLLLQVSCSQQDNVELVCEDSVSNYQKRRTLDEIIDIATYAASIGENSRSTSRKIKDIRIVSSSVSRSLNDTLIYAVNYENNEGFALISALNTVEPILAITDQGEYGSAKSLSNPGMKHYISAAENYIASSADRDVICKLSSIPQINLIRPRLLNVEWGLKWPEGMFCPNGNPGCAIVAIAQVLSYFETPTELVLTYPEKDIDTLSLDWDELTGHRVSWNIACTDTTAINAHYSSCNANQDIHYALGRLCRELGHRANATYGEDGGSSTYDFKSLALLDSFIGNNAVNPETIMPLEYYMERGYIAIIRGTHEQGVTGHMWVADGYFEEKGTVYYGIVYDEETGTYKRVEFETLPVRYVHFNWGWGGDCNGFFNCGVYDTQQGKWYDYDSDYDIDYSYDVGFWLFKK